MKSLSIATILMSGTMLAASTHALEISTDYLDNLTSPNVSWSDSTGTAVQIGDQTLYYTYTKPADYTETSEIYSENTATTDYYHKVFTGIEATDSNGVAVQFYTTAGDFSQTDIISDFVNNTTTSPYTAYGPAIVILSLIHI